MTPAELNRATKKIDAGVATFYAALAKDPTARGVIIAYGTDREVAKAEANIRKTSILRNYDISRRTYAK